jgi:hypothetical protein
MPLMMGSLHDGDIEEPILVSLHSGGCNAQ